MSKRACIYARYSSDKQHERSIDSQLLICRERAEREGWNVVETYSDQAITGASMRRPGLLAMLDDAKAGKFDIVIAESLDRISGDMEYTSHIYKRLSLARVKMFTLSESEIGELQIGFAGTFASIRLKQISEKTHRGQKGRIANGKVAGGNAYGYSVVKAFGPDGEPLRGEREVIPEQAAIINRIYAEYAYQFRSPERICAQLNMEGIPGPRGPWSPETLRGNRKRQQGILCNPAYVGKLVWNRMSYIKNPDTMGDTKISRANDESDWVTTDVPHLRIVSDELWAAVQARRDEVSRKPLAVRKTPPKLFSYLLRCGECGGGMAMISRKKYGCSRARKRGNCSNRLLMDREHLETVVVDALKTQLMPPELCRAFSRAYFERRRQNAAQRVASFRDQQAELTRVEREIANLIRAIKDGVNAAYVRDEMDAAQRRKDELTAALEPKHDTQPLLHDAIGDYYHRQIQRLLEWLNDPARREEAAHLIRKLITKIELTPTPNRRELSIDLYGDLAEILLISASNDSAQKQRNHGGLNHVQSVEIEQVRKVIGEYRPAAALEFSLQAPVVAGAGAAHARERI